MFQESAALKRNFRGEFNSKTTSIMPAGNHLIIGGLDVASFAAAAVQMSGFAPTFHNTSLVPQLVGMKHETSQFSSDKMGSGVNVKTTPHVDSHQFIDFNHYDVFNILQCNNSSSSKNRIEEQQNRNIENGVLPDTILANSRNSSDNILEEYKRLLYLETSQGVLVYFPDLKRKEMHIDQQDDRKRVEAQSDKNNKNSWRTKGNNNKNENMKEKKGREKKEKRSVEYIDNNNDNDNGHPDDDCNDDVGNWRDNDSEEDEEEDDEESEEEDSEEDEDEDEDDLDTPNFRNSISPKSKKDDYGFSDKNTTLRTKKKKDSTERHGQGQGQSLVRPVPGSIWKLLAPSSDDVSVGEI